MLAEAYARTGDFQSADERLTRANEAATALGDPDLLSTVGYRFVRRYLIANDVVKARGFLPLARTGASATSRVYGLYAESLILAFQERVADQAEILVELLRLLDPGAQDFHEVRAWATESLAILARELYLPHAIPEVERHLAVIWSPDFSQNRFQALKAIGWAKALQGDYFNAFRHLKESTATADSMAWKVVAACDRAYLAGCFGERRWSRVELDEAEQLAQEVDWHATQGEERTGLLLLAELFSPLDPTRSAMYLSRHRELGEIKSPIHLRHDARIGAFVQFSTGVAEIALGNKRRGITELRSARAIFDRFGYNFRAARCLVAESAATGDRSLLTLAEERLRHYGQSWLAAELRSQGERPSTSLPPMQQRVFDLICDGKSTAQIAQAVGRSEWTITNHIKQIFKTFGVKSRSALIAEALRRGLIGSQ